MAKDKTLKEIKIECETKLTEAEADLSLINNKLQKAHLDVQKFMDQESIIMGTIIKLKSKMGMVDTILTDEENG